MIIELVPDANVCYAHGQMKGYNLENIMLEFINGKYNVLVSTSILESGLDIPNVNTIIINQAHNFGLSDLHQIRGRVGRSERQSYCYLMVPSLNNLTTEATRRMNALEEFSNLGDGFNISMRDLDIRGSGNVLGSEQSGFVSELGIETYNQVLAEAIEEIKSDEFMSSIESKDENSENKLLTSTNCFVETDIEARIPDSYVSKLSERMDLYIELDELKTDESIDVYKTNLMDKYGPLPLQTEILLKITRMSNKAENITVHKIKYESNNLSLFFSKEKLEKKQNKSITPKILAFTKKYDHKCRFKETETNLILIVMSVMDIEDAIRAIEDCNNC